MPKSHKLSPEPGRFEAVTPKGAYSFTVRRRLPPDHPAYALIGRVAAEWAQLEHTLDTIIWELAGLDPLTGSCITVRIGCRLKCQAIMALVKKHGMPDALIDETNATLNRAQKKMEKRNRYVHDAWYIREAEDATSALGQFKSFTFGDRAFGFQEVAETAVEQALEAIRKQVAEVSKIKAKLSGELHSSR